MAHVLVRIWNEAIAVLLKAYSGSVRGGTEENYKKTYVRTVGVLTEIRNWRLSNKRTTIYP